jgi:hypothetical protein
VDTASVARTGTRHHRVDERFAALLDSDFGLRPFHSLALVGVPCKQALAVCFWAESKSADGEERGEMIQAYCRKRGVGRYDRRLIDQPAPTYGGEPLQGV